MAEEKRPAHEVEMLKKIDAYLDQEDKTDGRIERLEGIVDYCEYLKRLLSLSDDEKTDFYHSVHGYPLSDAQRETLKACKSEEERDYYINMWARGDYFRQCAWQAYLQGENEEKPSPRQLEPA